MLRLNPLCIGGMNSFHRPDFQAILLHRLARARCRTHNSKRLVSYSYSSRAHHSRGEAVTLHFQDGTTATCDLLVGADGVKSAVRACMMRESGESQDLMSAAPVWSGTMCYRATVPAEVLTKRYPNHRVLKAPHLVSVSM